MKSLEIIDISTWNGPIPQDIQDKAVQNLERGKVLYFPKLNFVLSNEEQPLISPDKADLKKKNISYDIRTDNLAGANCKGTEAIIMKDMIRRYALSSRNFIDELIPHYSSYLTQSKTSFRPVEIKSRKISARKDDTLLHVDSFPSNPVKGTRILRIFTNINPYGKPRTWRIGEPFELVVKKMAPRAKSQIPGVSTLLQWLKITKSYRTPYDHYMLQMHNAMKEDAHYQQTVSHEEIQFSAGGSWMVYTDQVSHAAMAGQYVLEQTFHLPVEGLKNCSTSPLKVLEKYFNRTLV